MWKDWIRLKKRTRNTCWRAASSGIVTSGAQGTESESNKEEHKQRGVRTKSASRKQHVGLVVMSTDTFRKFWQNQSRDGDRQYGKADASKDSAALLGQHSQATGHRGGVSHTQRHVNMHIDRYIYKYLYLYIYTYSYKLLCWFPPAPRAFTKCHALL